MVKAAMIQFQKDKGEMSDVYFTRHKNVREKAQIEGICDEASDAKALIVYTIVSPEVRTALADCAKVKGLVCVDLIGPLACDSKAVALTVAWEPMRTSFIRCAGTAISAQTVERSERTNTFASAATGAVASVVGLISGPDAASGIAAGARGTSL